MRVAPKVQWSSAGMIAHDAPEMRRALEACAAADLGRRHTL
jgi:hypothetical protein